ncbi:tail fiber assembly protein [Serratia fonticola]
MDKQLTSGYITKYALTAGIIKREGEIDDSGSFRYKDPEAWGTSSIWHTDFRLTEAEALAKAEDMRKKKIASLKKQIAKLEAMTFTIKE